MRCFALVPAALLVFGIAFAIPQQAPSTPPSDGLDLLKRVTQRYANAKTYALAATEEMSTSGGYDESWQKTVIAAAEAPGGRYYFEGHGTMGGAIRISDGKTAWKYRIDENHYTAKPVATQNAHDAGPIPMSELALSRAQYLRDSLANLARTLHSASLYPEETLTVDGKLVRCLVLGIRNSDDNRAHPNEIVERTIWIDKENETIVKMVDHMDLKHVNGPASGQRTQVTTTTYSKTVLDDAVPDAVFTFVPPAGAILISDFPDPRESFGPTMTGDTVPALKLKSADGKVVPIESFRGKPVLLDFWATWCAPCVAAMPKLAQIYKEGKDKGLVLLSIDQDEDAAKATAFLEKNGYSWTNFHDGDGEIQNLMGSSPIPRTVLVDAKGQIVYDTTAGDENHLRSHLAQLGPEFHDLAPRAVQAPPCVVSK